jgi:AcrR family transcriptional regulator
MWRAQAAASQRDRLLVAMAESVVEHGYAGTRVADVIAAAGVSRRAFYEHFHDLEDCLLATYQRGVEVLATLLGEVLAEHQGAEWRDLIDALLTTYLGTLSSEPVFAQVAMVEVLGAGPAARSYYLEAVEKFHQLMRAVDDIACRSDPAKLPASDLAISLLTGGLNRLVMTEVLAGHGRDLMQHHGGMLELSIVMLGGPHA